MKIGILGVGAMGLLYGGYLSRENEVYMLCRGEDKMGKINTEGVICEEADGSVNTFRPTAVENGCKHLPKLDVLLLFVKAGDTKTALEQNRHLISENTILLTLQNGSGHESVLSNYADFSQIAIGVSQDGSFLAGKNHIRHTGSGFTYFGMANGCENETLANFEKTCNACGFETIMSCDIKKFIWDKLLINASSSVMSGILGKPQGACFENKNAWEIVKVLVKEMVQVAKADGIEFDYENQVARMEKHLTTNPNGVPSICVDLKAGRKTEVDSISGSVTSAGKRLGVPTPTHDMVVNLVHAMECNK